MLSKEVKYKIKLRDTDATGVIYFTEQMRLALEVLEERFSLENLLEKESFFLPVVHAEADYFAPLTVGDEVKIDVFLKNRGNSSFSLYYLFLKEGEKVGQVTIVHVAVSKEKRETIPLPLSVIDFLKTLLTFDG